jgi:hypothetical protein
MKYVTVYPSLILGHTYIMLVSPEACQTGAWENASFPAMLPTGFMYVSPKEYRY